jgi:putative transposase
MSSQTEQHDVKRLCRVLDVSRSGYYAWRGHLPGPRQQANQRLLVRIREAYQRSQQTYGSPRIQAALRRAGVVCNRKRVARWMQQHGLVGRVRRAHRPATTQRDPRCLPAPNRLDQDFSAPAPDRKWVADFTYIDTAEGWLYLAVVLDLFSRRVVGWAMDERMESSLVQSAWNMAVAQRRPVTPLLHHSDQGRQYTSAAYQQALASRGCQVSMSRVGNCYDNAAMESFFATLKAECATGRFATRAQARSAIFAYIEGWYNRQRLHSSLGYLSPLEFELQSRH